MKLLLDTHVYLWWLLEDRRLTRKVRYALSGRRTTVYVSAVNIWQTTMKAGLGRLELQGQALAAEIAANGFVALPVSAQHTPAGDNSRCITVIRSMVCSSPRPTRKD